MTFNDLDAKMRVYEQSLDQIIPPENYLLARIDGRSFTRLTKEICQFEAPFDEPIATASTPGATGPSAKKV